MGSTRQGPRELPKDMKITITEDKATVYGRFLCDDHLPYLQRWIEHRKHGLAILVIADSRATKRPTDARIIRYDGGPLDEVKHWLGRAYGRRSGEPL
jgi:hypothetical protein